MGNLFKVKFTLTCERIILDDMQLTGQKCKYLVSSAISSQRVQNMCWCNNESDNYVADDDDDDSRRHKK